MSILIHLVFCSLAIVGVFTITRDGMVFGFVERFWLSKNNPRIADPVSECVICMSSIWGSLYYITIVSGWLPSIGIEIASIGWFLLALAGLMNFVIDYID